MTRCDQCQFENRQGVRFCEQCGSKLDAQCSVCGAIVPADRRFCGECGQPLDTLGATSARNAAALRSYTPAHLAEKILTSRGALEGERKLVTVLFCDIANSTALAAGLGPETMHGLLNQFFELALAEVHRYEGTINQFLGDGFMALFGAPIAHEDHARRAALAALAISRVLLERTSEFGVGAQGFQVRMGLNTGLVVVGKIGDNLRMDYSAVGDTTNLAARMQQAAEQGQICLTESTHHTIQRYCESEYLGHRTLKGKAEAVPVYRLLRARSLIEAVHAPDGTGVGSPLVGRDREVAALRASIDRLLTGSGGLVAVLGEAGLGKSRLMVEVRRQVAAEPLRWLEGRGLSFGRTMSYWPFLEIVRGAADIGEQDTDAESWMKLEVRLRALFPDEFHEVLPYVATLLGLEVPGEFAERVKYLDAQAIGRQIFRATRRLFERLAQERPLVLFFEDWHWADESSAALLEHLLPLTVTVSLLICWAGRPEPGTPGERLASAARQNHPDRYTAVALSPLSPAESATLVGNLFEIPSLPTRLHERILQRAEGNPFFIEEVVRSLIATRAVERDAGGWRFTTDVEIAAIPDTIQGVIMARVDRLEEDTRQVLKLASVIGRNFFYRILQAVTEAQQELDRHLTHLQYLELVRERRRLPELEYIFKHALVQEATYESILADRRKQLHRRVAECIEALFPDRLDEFSSLLAHHYARAEAWEKAQEYLFRAGDQAGRVAADAEALTHYQQAVVAYERAFGDRWDPRQRALLERKIGEALFRRGQHEAAREHVIRAFSHLGAPYPTSKQRLLATTGEQLLRQLGHRLLPGFFLRGRTVDAALVEERTRLYVLMGWIDYYMDPRLLLLDVLLLLNLSERNGFGAGVAQGSMGAGLVCDLIPLRRLASLYHARAVDMSRRLEDPLAKGLAHQGLAYHEFLIGKWDDALNDFRRSAAHFKGAGGLHEWALPTAMICEVLLQTAKWTEAEEHSRELTTTGQNVGDTWIIALGRERQGTLHCNVGRLANAEADLKAAADLAAAIPAHVNVVLTLSRLAHCFLRQGKLDSALRALGDAEQLLKRYGFRGEECMDYRNTLAEALLVAVDHAGVTQRHNALRKAARACRSAIAHGAVVCYGLPRAMRLRGTCAWLAGKQAIAKKWWHKSVATAERLQARYDLGTTYMEMGKRLKDKTYIEFAIDALTAIGARLDAAIAHRSLAETIADNDDGQAASVAVWHLMDSIATLEELRVDNELAFCYADYGRLLGRQGKIAQARDYLTRALGIFERLGTLREPDRVRAELAALPAA